jgi:hypothetical protein
MSAENRTVTLKASRLKILPQAIVLAAFLLPFLLLAIISGYTVAGKRHVELGDLAIFAIMVAIPLVFTWFLVRTLRRLADPDLLGVTIDGVELTVNGTRLYHSWSSCVKPVLQFLNSKSAARSIVLPQHCGGKLVILAEDYEYDPGDILVILEQAKAGFLTEPVRKRSNALYAFLAIPASCITLSASIIGVMWIALR